GVPSSSDSACTVSASAAVVAASAFSSPAVQTTREMSAAVTASATAERAATSVMPRTTRAAIDPLLMASGRLPVRSLGRVAGAGVRADEAAAPRGVELPPQPRHDHLEAGGGRLRRLAPDLLEDVVAGDGAPAGAGEARQHLHLAAGDGDLVPSSE